MLLVFVVYWRRVLEGVRRGWLMAGVPVYTRNEARAKLNLPPLQETAAEFFNVELAAVRAEEAAWRRRGC